VLLLLLRGGTAVRRGARRPRGPREEDLVAWVDTRVWVRRAEATKDS